MSLAIDNLKKYLLSRNWIHEGSVKNTMRFLPPADYDFSTAYFLDIPAVVDNDISVKLFKKAIYNIAELLDCNFNDLYNVVERNTGIMSFKFRSDDPMISNLKYPKFNVFHKHMMHVLNDSAVFTITGEYRFNRRKKVEEAQRYLNNCSFLQTEIGSFIVRVELPKELLLIENDWERGSVKAGKVNNTLLNSFDLATKVVKIDPFNENAFSDLIEQNKALICQNILEDVKGMYHETDNAPMSISYSDIDIDQSVVIDEQLLNNVQRIDDFNREVHELLENEVEIEVDVPRGAIIALKSKDPDSNANSIIATGYDVLNERMQYLKLYLDSYNYKEACLAHAHKHSVAVKGIGKQSINQISLRNPSTFYVNY